ncbi:hypothetical protein CQ019_18025 [Arthrobacter sp. MYb229]|uniref:class I SAM-dependent methyltransferase n=1 Tax=unclassified Arthrobacter TaxID=235627 RepID=UPI000CFBEED3|nr:MULTISPECIES: class I SAM-dependent methyltransferase [unclassified Arthrobacter]PQZ97428.1 hypothetical protein CQ019_18025 [Arthrobacter sp. MYb229]PRB46382.1 hypothetical protein CQ013_17990 [Arthrobacter sp. MYb216]
MSDDQINSNYESIKEELNRLIKFNQGWNTRLRRSTMEGAAEVSSFQYLSAELAPNRFMPVVGGWSIQYQVIAAIADYILHDGPESPTIVELGSGISTSWLALALKRHGTGRIISVEHDENYAQQTKQDLLRLGLTDYADVILAPLEARRIERDNFRWYDRAVIEDALGTQKIDILIVDGPPGDSGPRSRFPALPMLANLLNDEALLVLDDADRDEEQKIIRSWNRSWLFDSDDMLISNQRSVGRSHWWTLQGRL